ncbi:MAG: glycosyltransferase [Acidimicrobiales bacterium]|nr:glycosyltransferase [Acidimicrobiales bacterium]
MINLAVVVPATNSPPTLTQCLAAIHAADEPPEQLIVVDGPPSLSASGARNAGVRRATADVVVFVDADVAVHPDVFARLRAAFAADPDLAATYGSYDDSPANQATVSAFRNLLHHHVHQSEAGPAETFWTGLGAVRRSHFLAVGGFDVQRYPHPSIEDIDFGHQLASTGGRIVLDPTIQGTHLKVWTLRSMLWTDFARRGIPWVALQVRNRRVSNALNCGWRHRLSAATCVFGLAFAVLGMTLPALGAAVTLLGLNRAFYLLLLRRLGPVRAAIGVGLHGLHHVVSVAAVPAGIVAASIPWATAARRESSLVERAGADADAGTLVR